MTFVSGRSLNSLVGIPFGFWLVAFCCWTYFYYIFNKRIPYFCRRLYAEYDITYFTYLKVLLDCKHIMYFTNV